MMYDFIKFILGLFILYTNPIGICIVVGSMIIGAVLCKFTNWKVVLACICFCAYMLILGILSTLSKNNLDNIWMSVVFFPIFVILTIESLVYYTAKFIINKNKK